MSNFPKSLTLFDYDWLCRLLLRLGHIPKCGQMESPRFPFSAFS